MAEYLCFGDYICLYCEDTKGYMYSEQSSSTMDGLFVYTGQDREQPAGIPNVHAITFQVFSMNRYKLSKKYRALVEKHGINPDDEDLRKEIQDAKKVADVEIADNTAEQARLLGKRLRYGQTVQLLHVFSNKFIHISTDNTSAVDKSKMMVSLKSFSSKNALFKIQPRYKIKVEGEFIEMHDQIVLESLKSPGNFLHASDPYQIDSFTRGSELNAGVDKASFTLLVHYRQKKEYDNYIKGGDVIRLFHKDIEAYLVAEGSFVLPPVENVHLRIRETNPNDPRTLYRPKSGITYWQVELATSILSGRVVCWEDSVRFRHMTTRRYLALSENFEFMLSHDGLDPTTVFKIHSLSQRPEKNMIKIDSNVRIQHLVTGCWLHAPVDLPYEKRQQSNGGDESVIDGIKWDRADLLQVNTSTSQQYQDAFTLQKVLEKEWRNFNYIAGIVPFMEDLIVKRQDPAYTLTSRQTVAIITTLKDLKNFVEDPTVRTKDRQKLLRNLCTVDVMIRLLKTPISTQNKDISNLYEVFRQFYQVLHTYTKGRSKKNALYAANYMPFFMQQLSVKGSVGHECCKMMIDLIRDNRRIVDRITPDNIKTIIRLFKENQHYLYLDLLGVVSVCDNIAMTENQTLIAEELLEKQKENLYHIELGQDIGLTKDILYVSMDSRTSWTQLHTMSYKSNTDYDEQQYLFLTHQLDLFKFLCYGRNQKAINVITRNREFFTWEVAYLGLRSELLPFNMRAKFCDLLIGLFIEIGDNHSIIAVTSNNFVYGEIDVKNFGQAAADAVPHDFDSHFPSMRVWLNQFFRENSQVISSQPGRNILLKEVLRLITTLINYGFLGSKEELDEIMKPVFSLIDGTTDVPFEPGMGKAFTPQQMSMVKEWRKKNRFEKCSETDAIIQVKIQGLEMIEILLIKEFNRRVRYFVSVFKKIDLAENGSKSKRKLLAKLLYDDFEIQKLWKDAGIRKKIDKFLKSMYDMTELLDPSLPAILFDLTKYPSDVLNTKALSILNKFYSSKLKLFHTTQRSHALLTTESVRVHRGALQNMVVLTRLTKSKLSSEMADEVARILNSFADLCYVPHKPLSPHRIGQNILVNNGLLDLLIPLVTQEVDKNLKDRYEISQKVIGAGLNVLRFLAQKNRYVQTYMMDNLSALLSVQCCGEQQALALLEIFRDHTVHCLRLQPQDIQKIVRLAGKYRENASAVPVLLKAIIKMEDSETLLKRNQHLVTKYVMENYKSAAYVMSYSQSRRLRVLIGKEGENHQKYLINLIELLATCAEGENRYIESLCQTLMTVPELLSILNNRHVTLKSKVGCARYFIWAYMRTARNAIESGVDDLHHNQDIWKHIKVLQTLMSRVNVLRAKAKEEFKESATQNKVGPSVFSGLMTHSKAIATTPLVLMAAADSSVDHEGIVTYMIKAGFLLIQTFFSRFYKEDKETHPEEIEILRRLASATIKFTDFCGDFATANEELCTMVECIETLAQTVKVTKTTLEKICRETNFRETVSKIKLKVEDVNPKYNFEELDINRKMHNFGKRLATYLESQNTVSAQLCIRGKRANAPYVPEELEVKIPLGQEFQVHVKSFATTGPAGPQRIQSIIKHLEIAALNVKNSSFVPEEDLDIRCVQILRSLIYNKYISLPDNWAEHLNTHKNTLAEIKAIQDTYMDNNIVQKVLPLLDRAVPLAMEVLSLVDLLLFNSNTRMQKTLLQYFMATAEEIFFIFVRQRLQVACTALKERRSIKAQAEAKRREMAKKKDPSQNANEKNKEKEVKMNKRAMRKKSMKPFFQRMKANRLLIFDDRSEEEKSEQLEFDLMSPIEEEEEAEEKDTHVTIGNYQDGSDVVLVFRILARLCDGQYSPHQNYLRDQPDNLRKVNLVAEVTVFFGGMYTHINADTIDLATQVISALQEICMGNQENRAVVLNNKIIDYSNFLLRIPRFEECEIEQVVELKMQLVTLLYALIEENGPGATQIAKEIRDTLDLAAIRKHIHMIYSIVYLETGDAETLLLGTTPVEGKKKKKKLSTEIKEHLNVLGFAFYFIMARLFDIDPKLHREGFNNAQERAAYLHYKQQCRSVEVIKSGHLQRVHFRVRNPDLLREEVIEEVKWNIDRTSPSNKLRDLIFWAKDILNDVEYQNKILKNPIIKQMAKRWAIWNYAAILLSLAINIIMLATWDAQATINDLPDNITVLPPEVTSDVPLINFAQYDLIIYILGACHNFSSVMLFTSYLLLKHPRMPDFSFFSKCAKRFKKKSEPDIEQADTTTVTATTSVEPVVEEEIRISRLQPSLISTTTIYYLMLMVMSFAGTFYEHYFFSFHLLNIVANNELLKGVVKAVTQNGKSLLWVGIMGVIIIYLYALIAFAFLRASFNEHDDLYCRTLAQCFVTVLRYGVIGDITDTLTMHELSKNFTNFTFISIYQLSFFILFTTIGLNIIFGIIVDTFSELRDLKWTAEKDMRDTCFVCGRDSYDFEHESQSKDSGIDGPKGFAHHVAWEHNMWAYVFYLLHLKETNDNDCGAVDYYVLKLVRNDSMEFFPMNRALCLAPDEEDETDTKLDDVVATLETMEKRHKMEDESKRRETERRRQVVWQDQFRLAAEGRAHTALNDTNGSMDLDSMSVMDESTA